jgi:SAM-dependent methyltransferase
VPSTSWNRRWARDLRRHRGRAGGGHYGDHWGDPSLSAPRLLWRRLRHGERPAGNLRKVVRSYVRPHVTPDATVLEIGPGGGRFTQFLVSAREVVLVDLNPEFFPYLEERFRDQAAKLRFYQTSGFEIEGVEAGTVDFVLSFGTFVHIPPEGIEEYLGEIRRVLRPRGIATLQYADRTKPFFRDAGPGYKGFSDMNGPKMEAMVGGRGLEVVAHDRSVMRHSNVVVVRRPAA